VQATYSFTGAKFLYAGKEICAAAATNICIERKNIYSETTSKYLEIKKIYTAIKNIFSQNRIFYTGFEKCFIHN
jgi:hypothetical protein